MEYGWDKDTPPLLLARRVLFRLLAEDEDPEWLFEFGAKGAVANDIQAQDFRPFEVYCAVGVIYVALALAFEAAFTAVRRYGLREPPVRWSPPA